MNKNVLVASVVAALASVSTPILAAPPATELDPVTVVGNRTQSRTVLTSPVPIDVLGREEIRASGQTDLAKVLQTLLPSFNFPHPTTPDGNTHIRSATLRGLSPDQTLVLVNGKRRHTSAWVNVGGTVGRGAVSIDLNTIPADAIERIEVLRDGASALYGSDAIAGVINVVLREDAGIDLRASHGRTSDGGGDTTTASAAGGFDLGAGGVVRATAHYRDRKAANRALPDTRQQYFGLSPTGAPLAISNLFGSGIGLNPPGGPAGTRLDPRDATIDRNLWRFADAADVIERNLLVNTRLPLAFGDGVELYAFGGYGLSDGRSNASLRRAGQNENVRAIHPNGFLPYVDTRSVNYALSAGLRGRAGDWDWDLSSTFGGNDLEYRTRNTINQTLGVASPTAFYNGRLEFAQWTTNLDFKRSWDWGWHAPVYLATGLELRHDDYAIFPGEPDSYRAGPERILDGPARGAIAPLIGSQGFAGIQPSDAGDFSRHNTSVYAELESDLTDALLASVALRHEQFSDFGGTTNGKLALRYAFTDTLALRAAASTGFHAPALQQQYYSSTSSRTLANPNTGVPEFVLVRTAPVGSPEARLLGARELEPEESVNLTAGLTWGTDTLSASIDAYRIAIDDRIFLSSNFVDAPGSTAITGFLARNGLPGVNSVRFFANAADTTTRGIDVSLRQRFEFENAGTLTGTLAWNRNRTRIDRVAPTPAPLAALGVRTPLFDVTERTRVELGQPRDAWVVGLDWAWSPWTLSVLGRRYGEVQQLALTNQSAANVARFREGSTRIRTLPTEAGVAGNFDVVQILEPKWVADVAVSWDWNEDLRLTIGANNVANTYPTRNIASTAAAAGADTFGVFPYSELSPFGWSGRYWYARVDLGF